MHVARVFAMMSCCGLVACTGTIKTTILSPDQLNKPGTKLSGIVSYLRKPAIIVTELTQYSPDGGKTFAPKCTPQWTYALTSANDPAHPILIQYHPGVFETHTLKLTYAADGDVQSINSQGTPDQGKTLKNVLGAVAGLPLTGLLGMAILQNVPSAPPRGQPKCNTGGSFYEYVTPREGAQYSTDHPPSP